MESLTVPTTISSSPKRKKIGILGGMGTAAGLHFTRVLIESNKNARRDHDYPAFLLYSEPSIPSRVEAFAGRQPSPVAAIVRILQHMAEAEVDFAVIVCNTAHIYFDEIRRQSPINLIHIIENAATRSVGVDTTAVGLMATSATVESGIYQRHFSRLGTRLILPSEADQDRVMSAIFHPGYGLKATNTMASREALGHLLAVAENLRAANGIDTLILGCTELSMAIQNSEWHGFQIIDPVRLLVQAALEHAGYAVPDIEVRSTEIAFNIE